jgi:tetratricopeptide (TPR) repeat protein
VTSPSHSSHSRANFLKAILVLPGLLAPHLPASANISHWNELSAQGQTAFNEQKYKRASHFFKIAVRAATRSEVGDANLAISLKKLAESDIAIHKYREAEQKLQQAIKINKELGAEDPEAIRDLLELAKTYRSVNLEQFGKTISVLLKQSGLNKIEIYKTAQGDSRIEIRFDDKFTKRITSTDVDRINMDKTVTFDVHDSPDGLITLSNIKGLKMHSKMWVKLTDTSFDPNGDEDKAIASVTARKLGMSRTIQTVLPKPIYERILAIVERVKHPELHSPWHKQLQERVKSLVSGHPAQQTPATLSVKSKIDEESTAAPAKPLTTDENNSDTSEDPAMVRQ